MVNIDDNITDEMLAAYIDGNATPLEKIIVDEAINDEAIGEVIEITTDVQNNLEAFGLNNEWVIESIDDPSSDLESFKDLKKQLEEEKSNNKIL